MKRKDWHLPILVWMLLSTAGLESCQAMTKNLSGPKGATPAPPPDPVPLVTPPTSPAPSIALSTPPVSVQTLLKQSWTAYRQQFIQADGRVIDREAGDRSTSEGQAYAMLRAVMIDDRDTFDRTLRWAETNLQHQVDGKRSHSLWAWKWGKNDQGQWTILDQNFASDADIDAATALILASRRWRHAPYLDLARTKLQDLWALSTVTNFRTGTQQRRYLLPGPAAVFQKQAVVQLNPSYFAPAAFRLFAQVDPNHNWFDLVDSSYHVLQQASKLSKTGLPNDWVLVELTVDQLQPMTTPNPGTSDYGFDAYRVWWRIASDADWFKEPRARAFLQQQLPYLQRLWRSQQKIPARIDLQGNPLVSYEATSQYGMLYNAFRLIDPATAQQIRQKKLNVQYRSGFWDNDSAYYTQNLVWFGLVPTSLISSLFTP